MKKNKTVKRSRVEAKVDRLQEQLQDAIHAVRERRRGGAKELRAGMREQLEKRVAKATARHDKKLAKATAQRDAARTALKDAKTQLRALRRSTKQLLRLVFPHSAPILRNETEGSSSNPPTDIPATK